MSINDLKCYYEDYDNCVNTNKNSLYDTVSTENKLASEVTIHKVNLAELLFVLNNSRINKMMDFQD